MAGRSLFSRLLLAQMLLALALTAMLVGLFYVERNRTVAQLVAARWSPALLHLAGGGALASAQSLAPGPLHQALERPASRFDIVSLTPRLAQLREVLGEAGVPVHEALVGAGAPGGVSRVWVRLASPKGAAAGWIGFDSDLIENRLRERVVVAVLLLFALAVLASALIARRLARPLEALRARIAADDTDSGPLPGASTEVQAIAEAWRGLRATLERQERERVLLLAGVSHDLRSPLGRIRMAAELLPEGEGVAARREAIVRNAQLADRLVGSFLDHVRSGELPLSETVDLAALAREVVAERGGGVMPERAHVQLEVPAALPVANASTVLLARAMANLLDNAFAHGVPPVRLEVGADAGEVWIEVADHGAGIPAAQRDTLVQAFARADSSRSRPGLGLGLAIVQRVAQRLGGELHVKHTPGPWPSRVRMAWPRRAPTQR
jgi:two-component system, OmpR family, osmolarity sensor histidine kinase EnvZ